MEILKNQDGDSRQAFSLAVIIPTLGVSLESLKMTLESIAQLDKKPHVVVVTKTQSLALTRLSISFQVILIYEPDLGLYQALNRGVQEIESKCDFFTFLGDDDLLEKSGFEILSNAAKMDMADIIFGGINYIDANGCILFTNFSFRFAPNILNWAPNFIPNPGTIIRVKIWKILNGYNVTYKLASDLDFWIRAREVAKFKYVRAIGASFRFAGNSLTYSQRIMSLEESREIRKKNLGNISLILFHTWNPIQVRIAEFILRIKLGQRTFN
jgi:hypothetical protein